MQRPLDLRSARHQTAGDWVIGMFAVLLVALGLCILATGGLASPVPNPGWSRFFGVYVGAAGAATLVALLRRGLVAELLIGWSFGSLVIVGVLTIYSVGLAVMLCALGFVSEARPGSWSPSRRALRASWAGTVLALGAGLAGFSLLYLHH